MRRLIAAMLLVGVLGTEAMAEKKTAALAAKAAQTNVADRTGNISKRHREDLLRKIMEIREFFNRSDDKNAVRLRQFADLLAREVRGKKYGLVFEEHRERADVELESNLPILKENAKRFIDHGGEMNFLIEGENLAALKLLEKTHRNRIDFIYIDPPYNTGNKDFIYNDSYVDAKDTFRHSKWLSFMEKRLKIARTLLTERGIVFISIDDNELATLRLLCDDIFGDNFVATLPTIMNLKGNQDQFAFAGTHEYTVVYAKNKTKAVFNHFTIDEEEATDEWRQDEYGYYKVGANLKSTGVNAPRSKRPNLFFPLFVTEDNRCLVERESKSDIEIYPRTDGEDMSWRWSKEKFVKEAHNIIVNRSDNGKVSVYKKQRPAVGDLPTKKPKSLFYKAEYSSGNGTALLKEMFGTKVFSNPKPLQLIEDFVVIGSQKNSTVLDFFAGSGTTGHAVMRLNAQDGGRRRFILVTDNENGICENVTYERLKRAIKNEGLKARLKYMKIDYLPITEKLYYEYADDLLKNVRELVELENAVDFAHDASVAIVQSDAEYAAFLADEKRLAACRVLYVGHHVLRSAASEATLSARNVELREIPQYYYPELED